MSTDADTRSSPFEALKSQCFSELDHSQKAQHFEELLPKLPPAQNEIATLTIESFQPTSLPPQNSPRAHYENSRAYTTTYQVQTDNSAARVYENVGQN